MGEEKPEPVTAPETSNPGLCPDSFEVREINDRI